MAKILLCNPLFLSQSPEEQAVKSPYFPLGLLYLASYLRERSHAVALFDGTFEADESAFGRALEQAATIDGRTSGVPSSKGSL